MFKSSIWQNTELVETLKEGGVAVMPTDTLYGIVSLAKNAQAVDRVYEARMRTPTKPCIILISDMDEIKGFEVEISPIQQKLLEKYWLKEERPVSVVLDCDKDKFTYLHRGTKTLAFRMPKEENLRKFLSETGPLIAPSANVEGKEPSRTIEDAKAYFGGLVDFYLDGGEIEGQASRVVRIYNDGREEVIRE